MSDTKPNWEVFTNFSPLPRALLSQNQLASYVVNDPKYVGYAGFIYNRSTGIPIPPWEPTFLFRAKDKHAAKMIGLYYQELEDEYEALKREKGAQHQDTMAAAHHLWIVGKRRNEFERFKAEHAEQMQAPTTELKLVA